MDRLRTGALLTGKISGAIGRVSAVSTRARSPDVARTSHGAPTTSKYGGASPRGSGISGLFGSGEDGLLCRKSEISTDPAET